MIPFRERFSLPVLCKLRSRVCPRGTVAIGPGGALPKQIPQDVSPKETVP